jgi:hypothetical protein
MGFRRKGCKRKRNVKTKYLRGRKAALEDPMRRLGEVSEDQ